LRAGTSQSNIEGFLERLPALLVGLVRRQVTVIFVAVFAPMPQQAKSHTCHITTRRVESGHETGLDRVRIRPIFDGPRNRHDGSTLDWLGAH
jgi:hypothetical protein